MPERTLHDLIHDKACLLVVCRACRHSTTVFPFELGRKLGWATPVSAIQNRLVCQQCGAQNAIVHEASR
jgi:hypothetical protein